MLKHIKHPPLCEKLGKCKLCPACQKCVWCVRCNCVRCTKCAKITIIRDICRRCWACKSHHQDILPAGDFPFRTCTYTDQQPVATFLQNPLRRKIGVEIECEVWDKVHLTPPSSLIRAINVPVHAFFEHDGSVAVSQQELVIAPMLGDQLHTTLGQIATLMELHGAVAGPTAGYHVHVDALGATAQDLRRILFAWAAIEQQVYGTLVSKVRRHNKYCVPVMVDFTPATVAKWFSATGQFNILNLFYDWLYGVQMPHPDTVPDKRQLALMRADVKRQLVRLKEHKYEHAARRKAINFHAWMMRGTVEFRLKEGTTNPIDLLMWPQFCGWFVEHCINTLTDDEVCEWHVRGAHPSLLDLCRRFAGGPKARTRFPSDVLAWVEGKCRKTK